MDAVGLDSEEGESARLRMELDADLRAPHLVDFEVASGLRRMEAAEEISSARARAGLGRFILLPITRYVHAPLLERAWELRANVTAYDAAYIALAEGLGCTLLTKDVRLSRVRSARCPIEVLG